MPVKNVFLSRVKEIMTGMNDPFEEELRSITGPKRIFSMKAEAVLLNGTLVQNIENAYESVCRPAFPSTFPFQYHPFSAQAMEYGLFFDQKELLEETALLFRHIRETFCDRRKTAEVATDALMVVFWSNLLIGYFEHLVESELFRISQLQPTTPNFLSLLKDSEFSAVLLHMKLAYAFKNLYPISSYSRIPNGNPYDYQWVCRYYLRRKIDGFGGNAMDFVGETRWFDGLEKILRPLYGKDNYKQTLKYYPLQGLDDLYNFPVYLTTQGQMPAFSTTIKSSPRTLEDVIGETKEANRKFFREILHMVEFSFDLSVNLENDVGLAVENAEGVALLELFPRTYTHSFLSPFCDLICLPESVLDTLREEGKEELIKELIVLGFEMETTGKMILVLSEKIGWKRWNRILACIKRMLKIP